MVETEESARAQLKKSRQSLGPAAEPDALGFEVGVATAEAA